MVITGQRLLPGNFGQIDLLLGGGEPKLAQRTGLDLADTFFRDPHRGTNFFQRLRFLRIIQAEPMDDNLLFSVVKAIQDLRDFVYALAMSDFLAKPVGAVFFRCAKSVFVTGSEPITEL